MNVPKVMASPRQLIHKVFCATTYECAHEGAKDPSVWCELLDELLTYNNEMLLHTKSRKLYDTWAALPQRARGTIGPGVLWSVDELEPYTKIDEFTDDPEEFIHPGTEHPDCPACVRGSQHYHRKVDGAQVRAPGGDVPRETSHRDE